MLEPRENPTAVPAGLTDLFLLDYPLRDAVAGYAETHTPNQSSGTTVTVDESGTALAGTFRLEGSGTVDLADAVTATGVGLTGASGTTAGTDAYDVVVTGHYDVTDDTGPFFVDSESFTDIGSYTHTQTGTVAGQFGDHVTPNETVAAAWFLSWSGAVVGGAWTLQSYNAALSGSHALSDGSAYTTTDADAMTQTLGLTGPGGQGTVTETDSSDEGMAYTAPPDDTSGELTDWNGVQHTSGGYTGPTQIDQPPDNGSDLGLDWMAQTPTATGFTFHGTAVQSQSLTGTMVVSGGTTVVPQFTSTSHDENTSHVVEDEPVVSDGGGQENYHRDETDSDVVDVDGSGSYGDDTPAGPGPSGVLTAADYHRTETLSQHQHDILSIVGDHTTGLTPPGDPSAGDDDPGGEPFDLDWNYTSDRQSGLDARTTADYHDGPGGLTRVGSSFTASNGAVLAMTASGMWNGIPFNNSWGTSGGISASGRDLRTGIPATLSDSSPFVDRDPPPRTVFCKADGIPMVTGNPLIMGGPLTPVRGPVGNLQAWYNAKILAVGTSAANKVVRMWFHTQVMSAMKGLDPNTGNPLPNFQVPTPPAHGSFSVTGAGTGIQKWKANGKNTDLELAVWAEDIEACYGKAPASLSLDVDATYAVDGGDKPGPRSGYCVVSYKVTARWKVLNVRTGKLTSVERPVNDGVIKFYDESLKTMELTP